MKNGFSDVPVGGAQMNVRSTSLGGEVSCKADANPGHGVHREAEKQQVSAHRVPVSLQKEHKQKIDFLLHTKISNHSNIIDPPSIILILI